METGREVSNEERPISTKLLNHIRGLGSNVISKNTDKIVHITSEIKLDGDKITTNLEECVTPEHQIAQIKEIEPKLDKTREEEFGESVQGKHDEKLHQNGSGRQLKSIENPMPGTSKEGVPSSRISMTPSVGLNTGIMRVNKPSTLNLTTSAGHQAIEPPQPSAALKSLESARWLTSLDPSIYPPSIKSPDPCLNQDTQGSPGSFKYDKDFLLQFEKYFIEKPCLEFETRVKALIEVNKNLTVRYGTTRISENNQRCDISNTRTKQFDKTSFKLGSIQKSSIASRWDSFSVKPNELDCPIESAQKPNNISRQDTNHTKYSEPEGGFFIPEPTQHTDYLLKQDIKFKKYNEPERGFVELDSTQIQDDIVKQNTKKIKNDNKKFGLSGFSWGENRRPVDNITKEEFASITRQWREFKS
ncbi:putative eukaryotic initiation factor 4f subunit p130 [Erysiphe neolycopersici]|uniref:Putative eukaryotic initiation factor 4f subunit p130 n=1 Tax=Erysiphe neolycopersici TaxID=212602 RepID=A0A420I3W3_9PEZI|nr:putative eukaryotic initiation factor 4f subunit p130 [Erysiphe neolycopersici]